jgi:phosphohistidine phosphatase
LDSDDGRPNLLIRAKLAGARRKIYYRKIQWLSHRPKDKTLELYLIRHAEAAPLGEGGVSRDEDRPLTETGKEQARRLSSGCRAKGIQLGTVLTSPLLRARQTAEEMLRDWPHPAPELRVCAALAPGGKRRKLSRLIDEIGSERVALVGHQPDLGEYAAWLMGSKKVQLDLAKAGVAYLDCEQGLGKGDGRLAWLVTPEWLGTV